MPTPSFSLSISSRGNDFVIGGSGALDLDGVASLRQTVEESCKKEGAAVLLDLMLVTEIEPEAILPLVETATVCRDLGVPFSVTLSQDLVQVFNDSGYDAELLPLAGA